MPTTMNGSPAARSPEGPDRLDRELRRMALLHRRDMVRRRGDRRRALRALALARV